MKCVRSILMVIITLTITFSSPVTEAKERISVIYSSISALFLGLWVTQETGLFEKHGLEVKLIYIQSSPVVLQSMMAGEAQIAFAGGKPVVDSGLEGGGHHFCRWRRVCTSILFHGRSKHSPN